MTAATARGLFAESSETAAPSAAVPTPVSTAVSTAGSAVPFTVPSTAGATAEKYIETYYADGVWNSRRHDSEHPFASGDVQVEQIAVGAEVARWNQIPHIIRHLDGTVEISH